MVDELLRFLRNVNKDFKQSGWSFSVGEVVRGKCIGFLGMIHYISDGRLGMCFLHKDSDTHCTLHVYSTIYLVTMLFDVPPFMKDAGFAWGSLSCNLVAYT
ncbi:hypothetical protein Pyn_21094 [Prunus yedoensis var. nudiflora]|uniref:Uncharacterized protein n=1 Tax=Prunus yedoensis var. nudiflora TaxID=2094558 RepID=A0A314UH78_PRUYE|nr:hypothetical protein Pyn_21094 [Prunus yedoensis var. nudiflora]